MNNDDYRVFQILNAIGQDVSVSQRHLAVQMNISIGLVNSFIKRLVSKGYFKVVTIPKNRVKYILTPEGAAEKTRLTYNYIKYSYNLYKSSYTKIHEIFIRMALSGVKSVYFYGATDIAEISYFSMKGTGIVLVGIIDDIKEGDFFFDYKISSLDKLKLTENEKIIITMDDLSQYDTDKLKNFGISEYQIVSFDNY